MLRSENSLLSNGRCTAMHTIHVSFMTRTKRSYLFHAKVAHLREPKTVLDSVSHALIPGTRFRNLCRRNLDSWRGSLYMYLLSFPRFWTLSIERFWFLFWNIWNGVTPKTSNSNPVRSQPILTHATQNFSPKNGRDLNFHEHLLNRNFNWGCDSY